MKRQLLLLVLGLVFSSAGICQGSEGIAALEEIPVQEGGRVKPMLSFANEVTLFITGKSQFQGKPPMVTILEWLAKPEISAQLPIIPVAYLELQAELGDSIVDGRIAPDWVLRDGTFSKKVEAAAAKKRRRETLTTAEEKLLEVHERAMAFAAVAQGLTPGVLPKPDQPQEAWLPLHFLASKEGAHVLAQYYPAAQAQHAVAAFQSLLDGVRSGTIDSAQGELFATSLREMEEAREVALDYNLIDTEVFYLRLRPFHQAWLLYLASIMFSLPLILRRQGSAASPWRKGFGWIATVLFLLGFAIQAYGIYLRTVIAGRPPVSNMYESIIWVSWVVALFSTAYYFVWKSLYVRNIAALVAAFILILADKFPVVFSPAISPLVPVLRSNLWLTVHVLTITMSYGAFALAWGLGHALVFDYTLHPKKSERSKQLQWCLHLTLLVGVVLLAAGTILGGVWANYSWGRFWGWDPKETWALIALLGYLAVLHGRYAGWLGDFGIAVGAILAFLGVVVAWYGVNYVLAAGLHSYGFGGGGSVYVVLAAALDLILVGALAIRYRMLTKKVP